ncbi:MAG: hypothetical protein ACM34K_12905 [Bacillota bacterium]
MTVSRDYNLVRATAEDIKWISKLEASVYSGDDAIPFEVLWGWYNACPAGFLIVVSPEGIRTGHIDVLPVKSSKLDKFINGAITEKDILPSDLYTLDEKELVRDLYIESLAINMNISQTKPKALMKIISEFRAIAGSISNPDKLKNLYAISASEKGSQLLRHLGFKLIKSGRERIDRHELYGITYKDFASKAALPAY